MTLQAMVCAVSVVYVYARVAGHECGIVARPDDSSDVVAVKAHVAVDDHAEGLQLRQD